MSLAAVRMMKAEQSMAIQGKGRPPAVQEGTVVSVAHQEVQTCKGLLMLTNWACLVVEVLE